jgi:hypothetical protein
MSGFFLYISTTEILIEEFKNKSFRKVNSIILILTSILSAVLMLMISKLEDKCS